MQMAMKAYLASGSSSRAATDSSAAKPPFQTRGIISRDGRRFAGGDDSLNSGDGRDGHDSGGSSARGEDGSSSAGAVAGSGAGGGESATGDGAGTGGGQRRQTGGGLSAAFQADIAVVEPLAVDAARRRWQLQQEVRQLREQLERQQAAMAAEAAQLEAAEIVATFERIDLDSSGCP